MFFGGAVSDFIRWACYDGTMSAVRLGKNHLRWCFGCSIPILEETKCPVCGSATKEVEITPPGDVRPAFPHDIDLIKHTADEQFGPGSGDALIPDGNIVLLNKAPSLDRMDEIIANGYAIANIRYGMDGRWALLCRMRGAARITPVISKNYVVCGLGASEPIGNEGKNLMAPGVVDVHPDVRIGNEVLLIDRGRNLVATGMARMSSSEMMNSERGVAVKTKRYKHEEPAVSGPAVTWDSVIKANVRVLERRRDEAVAFMKKTMAGHDIPAAISFSGGKDSLAVLLLAADANLGIPVLFINTGLELNETVEYVHDVVNRYGMELIEEKAPENAFFGNLERFGPPAKDYRWCCKTNKLGPMVAGILRNFPDGVLSFIGQRRYESESRNASPRVWTSSWTPGQIGAAPIQDWNSLHVWMYIFWKNAPYNVWYEKGLDRIGCFLCPASDLSEMDAMRRNSRRYEKWDSFLSEYSISRGLPSEWARLALWRWKKHPQSVKDEVTNVTGKDFSSLIKQTVRPQGSLFLKIQSGHSPCVLGVSVEGALSRSVDLEKLKKAAGVLGNVTMDNEGQWLSVNNVTVFAEGSMISKGADEKNVRSAMRDMFLLIIRAEECAGCSLCVARCPSAALSMENGTAVLNEAKCNRCGKCFGRCPAADFREDLEEITSS